MLRASVVICAYTDDRWDDSLAAVESAMAQDPQPYEVILVVDHNPNLQRRFADRLPGVRVVGNAGTRGLSGARNTGTGLAAGEVVVFLDDDAYAEPGWLTGLLGHYRDPEVLGVGGRASPLWATARPRWWPAEFDWVVGCTYRGLTPGKVRNLIGSNASFRRDLFAEDGFSTGVGRTSLDRRPLGCEETEFCIRATNANPAGYFAYDDSAVVMHRVPVARQSFAYFRSRCWAEGISKALIAETVGSKDGLAAERRYVSSTLPAGVLQGMLAALRGDWSGLQRAAVIIIGVTYTAAGYLRGLGVRRKLRPVRADSARSVASE